MEAVKSITFLKSASSLAYGPQLGGMINYELKDGGSKKLEYCGPKNMGNY
jgi:outer membrane receptor protein involved in Fe transport